MYLILSAHSSDDEYYYNPNFALISVDEQYLTALLQKHTLLEPIPGLRSAEFDGERVKFIEISDDTNIPEEVTSVFEAAEDGKVALTDYDLSNTGWAKEVETEVKHVRLYHLPEAMYVASVKHAGIEVYTDTFLLQDVLDALGNGAE